MCVTSIYQYTEIAVRQNQLIDEDGYLHRYGRSYSVNRRQHKDEEEFV